jgi:hypothetical protein
VPDSASVIVVGGEALTIEHILQLARGERVPVLSEAPEYRAHLEQGRKVLEQALLRAPVYGVTVDFA